MASVEIEALTAGLKAWGERTHRATKEGVQEAGTELKGVIRDALGRLEYPPASPRGEPPARRSGDLQDSVQQRTLDVDGGYQQRVYPSIVYARIHELSGWAGKGHKSFLPKRPYVQPSLDEFRTDFRPIMIDAWREALPGG